MKSRFDAVGGFYAPLHPVWNPDPASLLAVPNANATQSFLEEIILSQRQQLKIFPLDYY